MRFSLRKRGLSKAAKKRILLIGTIFIVSFFGFVFLLNMQRDAFTTDEVESASMPTITALSKEESYGEFFGYRIPVDLGRVRNGLIPLDAARNLTIVVNPYGNAISDASYEVSTGTGERRIAKEDIGTFEPVEGTGEISADLSLSNLIGEGEEYMLTVRLTSGGVPLEYYMRIKYVENGFEDECMEFARYFMETAMSENYEELATYMEPRRGNRNGLSTVTINSSLNDVGWEGFEIASHTDAKVTFAEIDSNYTALNLRYIVEGERGVNTGTFIVDEYYRMRHGEERVYLLDFERNLTQIFDGQVASIEGDYLKLGQSGRDIEFISNRTGTNVAFVWNGNLYEYNAATNSLINVFYFGKVDITDPRSIHDEYDIKIISIDENGNLVYTVYGYMNAGAHEGICGIGLYHYDLAEDRTTEQAFLNTNHSYASLKAGFGGDIFLTAQGMLYLSIEDELITYDLSANTVKTIHERKGGRSYALSEEGRYLAFNSGDGKVITVTDIFTGRNREIYAPEGKVVHVEAFVGEDLVYGIIPESEYTDNNIENDVYPIEELIIADVTEPGGNTLKSYTKPGFYVTGLIKESRFNLLLELSYKDGADFIKVDNDSIQNTAVLSESEAELTRIDQGARAYVAVAFSDVEEDSGSSVSMKSFDTINMSYYSDSDAVIYKVSDDNVRYYAYRGMEVLKSDYFPPEAIKSAYQGRGYVVDNNGNYIWQYGRGSSRSNQGVEELPDTPNRRRISLRGCELEEVLSYIYRGRPVYVNEGRENALIITGFDQSSIRIYRISTGEEAVIPMDEIASMPEFLGKNYSVYVRVQT